MAAWETKPLGDLCEFQRGLTYGKSDEVDGSANVVLRANNVDLATHTLDLSDLRYIADSVSVPAAKKVRKGSLLICTASGSKSHLGKIAYIDDDYGYAFGGFMGQITPAPGVNDRYLFHALTSPAYKGFIEALSDGVNINNLKFDDLRQFPVPVPGLDEQRRIVAILDEAFEGIANAKANAEKNLQNARELADALGEACFDQNIDGSFVPRQLADLCDLIVDCEHKTAPTQESGYPSIRTPNIGKGKLILDDVNRVSEETYLAWTRRATPMPGDLILAREAPAGNVAVVPDGIRVCLGQRTVLIRPRREVFEPEYLAHLLLQRSSQGRLLAHSRGATVQHINLKDIRAFMISSVPSLETQRQVVEKLGELDEACESLRAAQRQRVAALEELKKSLLQQAFVGALTAKAIDGQVAEVT
jgi:type I restriction enzyme S subunit